MIGSIRLTQHSMLHDLFTMEINGKMSGGVDYFCFQLYNIIWKEKPYKWWPFAMQKMNQLSSIKQNNISTHQNLKSTPRESSTFLQKHVPNRLLASACTPGDSDSDYLLFSQSMNNLRWQIHGFITFKQITLRSSPFMTFEMLLPSGHQRENK